MEDDELDQSTPFSRASTARDGRGKVAARIFESRQTIWTDEKHNMYLNSVEESFVNQLYSNDYHLNNSLGWILRPHRDPHSSGTSADNPYLGQIKHHTSGYRENHKLENACTNTESKDESRILSTDSWVPNLRSSCNGKISDSSGSPSQAVCSRFPRFKPTDCNGMSSSKQFSTCFVNVYDEGCTPSTIEVSDQNFVEKEQDQGRLKVYRRKSKKWMD